MLYSQSRGCLRVVAASGKYGIRVGMPLAEATALAAIHCEQHDPLADQAALIQWAGRCEEFSPVVGIEWPENLCLDITGLGPLFGGEHALAQQVARAFRGQNLDCRIAIADTVGACWAVAHFGKETPVVLPPGRLPEALARLPVASLRLGADSVAILAELGIEHIGQLVALPRETLAARFGSELMLRLDQALGLAPETVVSHRPPADIAAETQLEYPLADRLVIDGLLEKLVAQVSQQLNERQAGAIRIECQLCCEGGETVKLPIGLFRASARAKHLLELVRLKLERVTLSAPLMAVKLAVLTTARLECWQAELFESSGREGRRQVSLLVDRLSNRLGREAVVRAVPQADAQPEAAVRFEPLAGVLPRAVKQRDFQPLPRPLRLETEPRVLEVLSVAPDGPPIQFKLDGPHRVARSWGPERIQTAWWRGRYVQRDYYRVETTAGRRFWIFRHLQNAKWYLHGVFD